MRTRRTALLLVLAALAAPQPAFASVSDVIEDCIATDGEFAQQHSRSDYRKALEQLPADADQYSACRDALRAALRGSGLTGKTGSGTPGGTTDNSGSWGGSGVPDVPAGVDPLSTATPEEQAKIAAARKLGSAPITLDGRKVEAGSGTISSPSDLPTPILIVTILLVAGALAATARWATINVLKRRNS